MENRIKMEDVSKYLDRLYKKGKKNFRKYADIHLANEFEIEISLARKLIFIWLCDSIPTLKGGN